MRAPEDVAKGAQHCILMDLDNWSRLFHLPLTERLPIGTVILGFAADAWARPRDCDAAMDAMADVGRFSLQRCGDRKDAADFVLTSWCTTLDRKLPRHVQLTIVSGDGGFRELKNATNLKRQPTFINPHPRPGEPKKDEEEVLIELLHVGERAAEVQPGGGARPTKRQKVSRLSHAASASDLAAARFWPQILASDAKLAEQLQIGDEVLVPRSAKRGTDPALTIGEVKAKLTEPVAMICKLCSGYHSSAQGFKGQTSVTVVVDNHSDKKVPLWMLGLLRQPDASSPAPGTTEEEPPAWPGADLPPWRLGAQPTTSEMASVKFLKPGKRTAAFAAGDCVVCCLPDGLVWGRLQKPLLQTCDGVWLRSSDDNTEAGGPAAGAGAGAGAAGAGAAGEGGGNTLECWEVVMGTGVDARRVVVPPHLIAPRRVKTTASPAAGSSANRRSRLGMTRRQDEATHQRVSSWLATGAGDG